MVWKEAHVLEYSIGHLAIMALTICLVLGGGLYAARSVHSSEGFSLGALFMAMTMEERARKYWENDEYLIAMKQEYERQGLYLFAPNSFAEELAKHAKRYQERQGIAEVS